MSSTSAESLLLILHVNILDLHFYPANKALDFFHMYTSLITPVLLQESSCLQSVIAQAQIYI